MHERSGDERTAHGRGEEEQVAGGDCGQAYGDAALRPPQEKRGEGAERERDGIHTEERAREKRAAMLRKHEQRQGDGEIRVRDPGAERRGDEGAAGLCHERHRA